MCPEAERRRLVEAALEHFCRAMRQVGLYSEGHPIAAAAVHNAAQAMHSLPSDGEPLEITVSRNGLEADHVALDLGRAGLGHLHELLHAHLIQRVVIRPGVQSDEISALIGVLNTDPADLEECGGATGKFAALQAPHIQLEQHDYRRLLRESEARWLAMFSGAAEARSTVVEQLVSLSLGAVGESETLLARAQADTGPAAGGTARPVPQWAAAAEEMAASREEARGGVALAPQTASSALSPEDYLAHSLAFLLQSAWEALAERDYSERVRWRHQVGQLVALLTPEMRARVFRANVVPGLRHTDVLSEMARAMSADEAVELVMAHPNAVVNEPSAQLESVMRRVMSDEQRLMETEPLLRQRLTARGMSEDAYRSVVGLLLDRIAKDRAVARADLGGNLNIVTAAAALGEEGPNLSDLVATLTPPAPTLARRQVLLEILGMDLTSGQFSEAVECVGAEVARSSQEREMAAAVGLAAALAREADPATGRSPTQRAIAAEALRRSGTSQVVACLAEAFRDQPAAQKLQTVQLLGQMGEASAGPLLAIIGSPGAPQVAAEALRALARMGLNRAQTSRAVKALAPERAAEIIAALATAASEGAAAAMGLFLEHRADTVRQRTVQRLAEVPGPGAQEILLGALFDSSPEIRAGAAESLGRIGARGAVLALSMAANQGPLCGKAWEVRKAAVRALGRIGAVEGTAPLIKVLHTGSLLFRGRSDALRALAALSLAGIAGDEANQALLAGLRERRKAVSDACRQALQLRSRREAQAQARGGGTS